MRKLLLAAFAAIALGAGMFALTIAATSNQTPKAAVAARAAAPVVANGALANTVAANVAADAAVGAPASSNAGSAAAAPAGAAGGVEPAQISVWCSVDDKSHDGIQGIAYVADGSHGTMTLRLVGASEGKENSHWEAVGQTTQIDIVPGQNSYPFQFDLDSSSKRFQDYRVAGQSQAISRIVGRDECGFRVPEAPSSSLLLLAAGLPAAAWIGARRFGIRIRVPFRR